MAFGFGSLNPTDDSTSPEMAAFLRARLAGMPGMAQQDEVPAATAPGFTGYAAPFAPTGPATPVVRDGVPPLGSVTRGVMNGATEAGQGLLHSAVSGFTLPRDVYQGKVDLGSDEAIGRTMDLAGLMAGGSASAPVPKGALRSFGGAAAAEDPMAALEASLAHITPEAPPPGPRMLDPNAKSWDVYHGSHTGPNFERFDPNVGSNKAEHGAVFFAPNPETASGYAGQIGSKATGEAGPRVYRTTVDPGKSAVFDLAHLVENDPSFNARARDLTVKHEGATWGPVFDDAMSDFARNRTEHRNLSAQAEAMGYPASRPEGVPFGYGHIGAAVQMAKEQGLDTAIIRGLGEHGGDDQVIALTPNRVRSYYDPSQVLYSGGPTGLVGALPLMTTPTSTPRKVSP